MTIKIDGVEKIFIVDTRSPVTIVPSDDEIIKDKIFDRYQEDNRTLTKSK